MHIKKIKLQHFRNIEGEIEISLGDKHTIVLGANGSGKSNIPLAIAFVLNCGRESLGIDCDVGFINQAHRVAAPDSASCTVRALLELDDRTDVALQRTVHAESEPVYEIDDEPVSDVAYKRLLRDLGLQSAALLYPQRLGSALDPSEPYGYGKYFESLCYFLNELEFTPEEEQHLQTARTKVSRLKQRVLTHQRMIAQIGRLKSGSIGDIENIEERLEEGERLLLLADLWKKDERRGKQILKLRELRGKDVESRRKMAEAEIGVIQNELAVVKGKLEQLRHNESLGDFLEGEVQSQTKLVERLESSKNRLQDLISKVQNSKSSEEGPKTELIEKLLLKLEQLEYSNTLGGWLHAKMKGFDERFREEHPEEAAALKNIESQLEAEYESCVLLRRKVDELKHRRFFVKEEKRSVEAHIEALKKDKSWLETKLEVQRSFAKKHDDILREMKASMVRKRNRLHSLRQSRRALSHRSIAAERNDFDLRCLIDCICECFAEEIPARAVYGLLKDLMEPKEEAHETAFRRMLGESLDAIVVKDQATQRFMRKLLRGDTKFKPPRSQILVMPTDREVPELSKDFLSRLGKGVVPLADTWVVSKEHRRDRRMSDRIMRMIRNLTRDVVFCTSDSIAQEIASRKRGEVGRAGSALMTLTADGTLCSDSGTLRFFSMREPKEPAALDSLKSVEEIVREIRVIEHHLKRKPGVAAVLYQSLQHRLEVSMRRTTKSLDLINTQLEEATLKLSQLGVQTQNCDEVLKVSERELTMLRDRQQVMDVRKERRRINLIRLEYIRDIMGPENLDEVEVSNALERNQKEIILEQDHVLKQLAEIYEEEMTEQWRFQIEKKMESSGKHRMEEVLAQLGNASTADQEARRSLAQYRRDLREKLNEKECLLEASNKFNARLSELFQTTRLLHREAATDSITETRLILSIRKLQKNRRDLIRKLNLEGADSIQSGDEDSDLDVDVDDGRILDPGPIVDYTGLPESAKSSEDSMTTFMKSVRKELTDLRSKKLDRVVRSNDADLPAPTVLESRLREKRKVLEQCKRSLKLALVEMKAAEKKKSDFNARHEKLLKTLYDHLRNELPKKFKELTNLRLAVDVKKSSDDNFHDSEVTLQCFFAQSEPLDCKNLSSGMKVFLWLSVVLTIQEVFKVPLLVLDEIDARTSAPLSANLHAILHRYALLKQVICISHKPETVLDVDVRLVGVFRCPVSRTTKVMTFDPCADFSDDELEFHGQLSAEDIDYILKGSSGPATLEENDVDMEDFWSPQSDSD